MKLTATKIHAVKDLIIVAKILYACGKDMAENYDLHHWDNPYLKALLIVAACALKNNVYLVLNNEKKPVATFQTRINGKDLHFEKLAVAPQEAGKGIGSFCLETIEQQAKAQGCNSVVMEVYDLSKHAIKFYEHRGYKEKGITDTLKYKEIKMEKSM